MKLSNYNMVFEKENELIVYNSISGGVLSLKGNSLQDFSLVQKQQTITNQELIEALKTGRMILDDNIDEEQLLEIQDHIAKFGGHLLTLTIAPTLNCNFKCPYCYEEGCSSAVMNDDIILGTVEFVKKFIPTINQLGVTWYGGEPLLCFDTIQNLSEAFINLCGDKIKYTASIVTNGYLLDRTTAMRLRELKVMSAQITLDGGLKAHNKRRILKNGQGTYNQILQNIIDVHDLIRITVRANVDKDNIEDLDELMENLLETGLRDKISFYIAPVNDMSAEKADPICFTINEFSINQIDFWKKAVDKGFNLPSLPRKRGSVCGAVRLNNYVIDPTGDLFKCWHNVGRKEERVGNVLTGPELNKNHLRWLSYDAFKDEKCTACSLLPACLGNCPYYYFRKKERLCLTTKFNGKDTINLIQAVHELRESTAQKETLEKA